MSNRKHDPSSIGAAEIKARKLKLAEGGIIFALVLSLCIYLGIRFADDDGDTAPVAAAITAVDAPPATMTVTETSTIDESASTSAAAGGTEPAPVVESEISAATGATPPLEQILPGVPLVVTYSSAEKAFFDGRYETAADMFATYCDEHPENAWGHYMRGLSLWKAGSEELARSAFNEALLLKPGHFKSLVNLARVELDLADPDAALVSIERALDVAPDNVDARRVLGRVYHNLDRSDEAVAAYMAALQLQADDAWTLNNLALVWIENEEFELAVAPLARAVELSPEAAVIRNNLGIALERTGHLGQACEQYAVAGDLGSDRGAASHARLDAVILPVDDPVADLTAIAAAWSVPDHAPATLTSSAVAAVTLEDAENAGER